MIGTINDNEYQKIPSKKKTFGNIRESLSATSIN